MKQINGQTLKRMLYAGRVRLAACAEEINELNVFPVPDGDTGSNMLKTLDMGWKQISLNESESVSVVMSEFASGAVLGARGNSGVILSQIFRGIAKGLQGKDRASVEDLSSACALGVDAAYSAVMKPVEGTILTVFREASSVEDVTEIEEWFAYHIASAKIALRQTPDQLPALKEAGVVDSGGAGYLRLIEGMMEGLTGEELAFSDLETQDVQEKTVDFSAFTRNSVLDYGYCTEFFLRLQSIKVDIETFDDEELKDFLGSIGNSLVYVRADDLIKVHVHTKCPGQVLNECQKYGEFLSLKVENMNLQHEEMIAGKSQKQDLPKKHVATVMVAMSDGMKALFEENGADAVIFGGANTNPSTGEFLEAFRAVNADNIVVLPNNSNVLMAAQTAAMEYLTERPDVNVYVLPSKSMQAGFASLMLATDSEDVEAVLEGMRMAIDDAVCLSLTYSIRNARIGEIEIEKDDFIGFSGKELVACAKTSAECIKQLFESVEDADDKEIVTVMYGVDASDEDRETLSAVVEEYCPDAEILEYECGQEIYRVLITLE